MAGYNSAAAGNESYRLNEPMDLFFDRYGSMYVVDTGNHRIQLFPPGQCSLFSTISSSSCLMLITGSTSSTSALTVAGVTANGGSGYSQLLYPTAICVDINRTMYILDTNNYRVVKWLRDEPLGFSVVGNRGSGSGLDQIGTSYGMYIDHRGNIYVSEYSNHRVTMWYKGNTTAGVLVSAVFVKSIEWYKRDDDISSI